MTPLSRRGFLASGGAALAWGAVRRVPSVALADGRSLDDVVRRLRIEIVASAGFYLVCSVTFVERVSPDPARGSRAGFVAVLVVAQAALIMPAVIVPALRISRRWLVSSTSWLADGRPPTSEDRHGTSWSRRERHDLGGRRR